MFERFTRYRLAPELKAPSSQRAQPKPTKERRGMVSIGVIDDSPFPAKNNLEALGYRIRLLGDPSRLDAVEEHHIMLCDLQGVGQSLGGDTQGAFLIREIRENYPENYVIAYTGGMINQSMTRDAIQASDAFLKKDADIETWNQKLDEIIEKLLDPYQVWQRQRKALVEKEVDTKTILLLEDKFVRAIAQKEEHEGFTALAGSTGLGEDARAVVRSLISSGLFKLLTGS